VRGRELPPALATSASPVRGKGAPWGMGTSTRRICVAGCSGARGTCFVDGAVDFRSSSCFACIRYPMDFNWDALSDGRTPPRGILYESSARRDALPGVPSVDDAAATAECRTSDSCTNCGRATCTRFVAAASTEPVDVRRGSGDDDDAIRRTTTSSSSLLFLSRRCLNSDVRVAAL
jgi:hypothetical protein